MRLIVQLLLVSLLSMSQVGAFWGLFEKNKAKKKKEQAAPATNQPFWRAGDRKADDPITREMLDELRKIATPEERSLVNPLLSDRPSQAVEIPAGRKGAGQTWPADWALAKQGQSFFAFDANVDNDLYIYFSDRASTDIMMVMWGWGGAARSVLRKKPFDQAWHDKFDVKDKNKSGPAHRKQFRQYRFFFDGAKNTFIVTVDGDKFFEHTADFFRTPKQFEFSSYGPGYTVRNAFTAPIEYLSNCEMNSSRPADQLPWQKSSKLPVAGEGVIEFMALGKHDINFYVGDPKAGAAYFIALYGWGGTKSVVRKVSTDNKKVIKELVPPRDMTNQYLNIPMNVQVVIEGSKKEIRILVNGEQVISFTDPEMNTKLLTHMAPSSHSVPVAYWDISAQRSPLAFNADSTFQAVDGKSSNVTFGNRGDIQEVWCVGLDSNFWRFDSVSDTWVKQAVQDNKAAPITDLKHISMSQDGILLFVRNDGSVWRYFFKTKRAEPLPAGKGNEALKFDRIAVGSTSSIWALKLDTQQVYTYSPGAGWKEDKVMKAKHLSAGRDGTVAAVTDKGDLFIYDPAAAVWTKSNFPSPALKVAVADTDSIYVLTEKRELWLGDGEKWEPVKEDGQTIVNAHDIATGGKDKLIVTDRDNSIYIRGLSDVVKAATGEDKDPFIGESAQDLADKMTAVELLIDPLEQGKPGDYKTWKPTWRLGEDGQGIVHFEVAMRDGLHVGLSKDVKTLQDMVELVLFGSRDLSPEQDRGALSVARAKPQGDNLKEEKTLLEEPSMPRDIFIVVDSDRDRVAAFATKPGKDSDIQKVISFDYEKNPELVQAARSFSFACASSPLAIGDIWVAGLEYGSYAEGHDIAKANYEVWLSDWNLPARGEGSIKFTAIAWNDIRVAIGKAKKPSYEVVIWSSAGESFIQKADGTKVGAVVKGENPHPGAEVDIEIKLDKKTKTITVLADDKVLVEAKDDAYDDTVTMFSLGSGSAPVLYVDIEGNADRIKDEEMAAIDKKEDIKEEIIEKAVAAAAAAGKPVDYVALAKELQAQDPDAKVDAADAKKELVKKVKTTKLNAKSKARKKRSAGKGGKKAAKKARGKASDRPSRKSALTKKTTKKAKKAATKKSKAKQSKAAKEKTADQDQKSKTIKKKVRKKKVVQKKLAKAKK